MCYPCSLRRGTFWFSNLAHSFLTCLLLLESQCVHREPVCPAWFHLCAWVSHFGLPHDASPVCCMAAIGLHADPLPPSLIVLALETDFTLLIRYSLARFHVLQIYVYSRKRSLYPTTFVRSKSAHYCCILANQPLWILHRLQAAFYHYSS
jgi:hypothetical protein